jgi:hypothetical protein
MSFYSLVTSTISNENSPIILIFVSPDTNCMGFFGPSNVFLPLFFSYMNMMCLGITFCEAIISLILKPDKQLNKRKLQITIPEH